MRPNRSIPNAAVIPELAGIAVLLFILIFSPGCVSPERRSKQQGMTPEFNRLIAEENARNFDELSSGRPERAAEFSQLIAEGDAKYPILPDESLIGAFKQHSSIFEELRQMIVSDSRLHRVGEDWTDPRNPATVGASPERIAEYRRLLTEVGCSQGFIAYPARPGIYIISGARGLSIAGATKGYCYMENTPASVVANTETYRPTRAGDNYEVFRSIEGHWYIYFECH